RRLGRLAARPSTDQPRWEITSSAWLPIEPVAPSTTTWLIGSQQAADQKEHVSGRDGEQEAVDAVEHAPVAGKHRAHVLDAEGALDHRLGQVPQRTDRGDDCSEDERAREPDRKSAGEG